MSFGVKYVRQRRPDTDREKRASFDREDVASLWQRERVGGLGAHGWRSSARGSMRGVTVGQVKWLDAVWRVAVGESCEGRERDVSGWGPPPKGLCRMAESRARMDRVRGQSS